MCKWDAFGSMEHTLADGHPDANITHSMHRSPLNQWTWLFRQTTGCVMCIVLKNIPNMPWVYEGKRLQAYQQLSVKYRIFKVMQNVWIVIMHHPTQSLALRPLWLHVVLPEVCLLFATSRWSIRQEIAQLIRTIYYTNTQRKRFHITSSSAITEGPRKHAVSWNRVNSCTTVKNSVWKDLQHSQPTDLSHGPAAQTFNLLHTANVQYMRATYTETACKEKGAKKSAAWLDNAAASQPRIKRDATRRSLKYSD